MRKRWFWLSGIGVALFALAMLVIVSQDAGFARAYHFLRQGTTVRKTALIWEVGAKTYKSRNHTYRLEQGYSQVLGAASKECPGSLYRELSASSGRVAYLQIGRPTKPPYSLITIRETLDRKTEVMVSEYSEANAWDKFRHWCGGLFGKKQSLTPVEAREAT